MLNRHFCISINGGISKPSRVYLYIVMLTPNMTVSLFQNINVRQNFVRQRTEYFIGKLQILEIISRASIIIVFALLKLRSMSTNRTISDYYGSSCALREFEILLYQTYCQRIVLDEVCLLFKTEINILNELRMMESTVSCHIQKRLRTRTFFRESQSFLCQKVNKSWPCEQNSAS